MFGFPDSGTSGRAQKPFFASQHNIHYVHPINPRKLLIFNVPERNLLHVTHMMIRVTGPLQY
jgi:hypothetical protein